MSYTIEEFISAVKSSESYAEVILKLNLKRSGSNYITIKKKIDLLHLDISHFTGQNWTQSKNKHPYSYIEQNHSLIFVENSFYGYTARLKAYLIKKGLLEYKCLFCGNTGEYLNKPLTLELDHINGIRNDNRLENLRILCPNCHSQTPTHRNSNKLSTKNIVCQCGDFLGPRKKVCLKCAPPRKLKIYYCNNCKTNEIPRGRNICDNCKKLNQNSNVGPYNPRKNIYPDLPDLLEMIQNSNSNQVAFKLGVSRTALINHVKRRTIIPNL